MLDKINDDCSEMRIQFWCKKKKKYILFCDCIDYVDKDKQKVHIEHFRNPMDFKLKGGV